MKMEKALRSALLLLLAAALCLSMAACTQTPAESSPVSETQTRNGRIRESLAGG